MYLYIQQKDSKCQPAKHTSFGLRDCQGFWSEEYKWPKEWPKPLLWMLHLGDEILPSYKGIIVNHYKDSYCPTRISWNVISQGFVAVAHLNFSKKYGSWGNMAAVSQVSLRKQHLVCIPDAFAPCIYFWVCIYLYICIYIYKYWHHMKHVR